MACSPSRAEVGRSLITAGFDQVRPASVDRQQYRSLPVATALTRRAPPLITTRGPRWRPSSSFGRTATLAGLSNDRPLSDERASQIDSPLPNTSMTSPFAAANCGWRFGSGGSTG